MEFASACSCWIFRKFFLRRNWKGVNGVAQIKGGVGIEFPNNHLYSNLEVSLEYLQWILRMAQQFRVSIQLQVLQ